MKDLLEKIIKLIPTYIIDFLRLLSGPKRFVAERLSNAQWTLENSLIFLAVSFSIGEILEAPLLRLDPLVEIGSGAIFFLIMVMAYGAALYLAWRIAGGSAEFQKFLLIHFYYAGVLKIISASLFLALFGILKAGDPVLFKQLQDTLCRGDSLFMIKHYEQFIGSRAFLASYFIQFAGFGAALTWIFVGWGAYRELNKLSRPRSVLAAVLFSVFSVPVTAVTFFIATALLPSC